MIAPPRRPMYRPLLAPLCLLLATVALPGQARAPRPNIVLILADDLGWSDLGVYGGEIPTPNLDRLATQGLRFTQFYNNSVCGPSRASLLTGLYAQRVGHSGTRWNDQTDFNRSVTLGEILQRAGYRTMMVGKWQERDLPADRGFDRYYGPMTGGIISYYHEVRENPFYLDRTRIRLPDKYYLTEALTDHALGFLREATRLPQRERPPFFLYVAHIAPHWPLHAPAEDIEPHRARYQDRGWDYWHANRHERQQALGLLPSEWRPAPRGQGVVPWNETPHPVWQAARMAAYAAQVESIDRSTGRIMEALRAAGEADNTLVIFLSDNGAAHDGGLGPSDRGFGFAPGAELNTSWRVDRGAIRPGSGPDNPPGSPETFAAYGPAWAWVSNTPFRDTKLSGYEGGIRTPLIAHWPAGIRGPGRIIPGVGHVVDFMPTFLELAGATYPAELEGRRPLPTDGVSLAPQLRGESGPAHDWLAWRTPWHRALRAGNWKIVSGGEHAPWELYDLVHDGTETTDLAALYPEKVGELAAMWREWSRTTISHPSRL